ncbi:hypothetical protein F5J12DRAFT_787394 [Pisolithus orientalis]|uniref:uncharacterized protein n=1 Tax=Pisolithus orientalis TaxID=936130 RepID=UPI0022257326|nr:uncharacterized protein F5J12DRAFT_787394 [Pisolithus orientalis]KAI5985434.1 hypothetical protein F5J12DRAFT_787394 [Pisolithus orientalis]
MATQYFPSSLGSVRNESSWTLQVISDMGCIVAQLPAHYYEHLQAFFWREKVIRLVLQFQEELEVQDLLKVNLTLILIYMDRVFTQMVREAKSTKRDACVPDWCSPTFDNYILIEYHVEHHEPEMTGMNMRTPSAEIWYGSSTQFKMEEKDKTLEVEFYDPIMEEDPDFGYTYKEHLEEAGEVKPLKRHMLGPRVFKQVNKKGPVLPDNEEV